MPTAEKAKKERNVPCGEGNGDVGGTAGIIGCAGEAAAGNRAGGIYPRVDPSGRADLLSHLDAPGT